MTRSALAHLTQELAALASRGRLRERSPDALPRDAVLNLCSNDYLGYLSSARLSAALRLAADEGTATGAGASRLVSGDCAEHRRLELLLAEWLGCEDALLFSSGYAANVGVISALAGPDDHVVSDALNHASIIDGCRLSRARLTVVPHLELEAVRNALRASSSRRQWVVAESYYSMDADGPDLAELRGVCDDAGAALILDEAHALGVFGPSGRGRAAQAGVSPDVFVGTLGKAAAGQGAFVAGSRELCAWLWNRARSFVYSTGISPVAATLGWHAVRIMAADEEGRARLASNTEELRATLRSVGLTPRGDGPIIPVVLGSESRAVAWGRELLARGVMVQPIRPPTVAAGSSRLRVTARADLSAADHVRAREAFGEVAATEER